MRADATWAALRHFSWNRHDVDAVVAGYAKGATYSHPRAGENLTGEAIRNFVKAVWVAYPDASLGRLLLEYVGL
jgi:hypothetical protein